MSNDPTSVTTKLGQPLPLPRPIPIEPTENTLGYGFDLSEAARRDIEEIERAIIRR